MPLQSREWPDQVSNLSVKNPYIEKLSTHSHLLTTQAQVWDYFSKQHSILEIGCGHGHFLANYLLRRPELTGLGVDRRFKRLFKTGQKLGVDSKSKVFFGDAPTLLKDSPADFWEEIWMQFPDPWPKDRHSKNRMLNEEFMTNVFRSLKPGGMFCFISDHKDYWEELQNWQNEQKSFSGSEFLAGDLFADLPASLFKISMIRHHVPIFSARLSKTRAS